MKLVMILKISPQTMLPRSVPHFPGSTMTTSVFCHRGRESAAIAGKDKGSAIGSDLKTMYFCVNVCQYNHIEIIVDDQGNHITPSYITFTYTERLIGDATKNHVTRNPISIVLDTKVVDWQPFQ